MRLSDNWIDFRTKLDRLHPRLDELPLEYGPEYDDGKGLSHFFHLWPAAFFAISARRSGVMLFARTRPALGPQRHRMGVLAIVGW